MRSWKQFHVPLVLGVLIVGLILSMILWQQWQAPPPIVLSPLVSEVNPKSTGEVEEKAEGKTTIMVDVSGAVVSPGVYTLPLGDRIESALTAAGGMTAEADLDALPFSRAAVADDEQRIYVPRMGETPASNSSVLPVEGVPDTKPSCISINQASEATLDTLKGIGPARAAAIVSGRPYAAVDDLLAQAIIPASVFAEIESELCL